MKKLFLIFIFFLNVISIHSIRYTCGFMNCKKTLIEGDAIIVVAIDANNPGCYIGHQNCMRCYNAAVAPKYKVVSFQKINKTGCKKEELDNKIKLIIAEIAQKDESAKEKQKERDYETRISDAAGRAHDEMKGGSYSSLLSLGSADTSINIFGKCMRGSGL